MKRSLIILCFSIAAFVTKAQTATTPAKPAEVLLVKETGHDFGKIQQGRPVHYSFEIVNTGKEPLLLENVQASCGCTTPEWTREPIAAGATSFIKVGYNAAAEGAFQKTITIQYNNSQTKVIAISGTVFKAPTTSAPLNTSLSLLKN
jgi:hypothetical protein